MNSFNKRVYEMLTRVLLFVSQYKHHFPEGSVKALLAEQIHASVLKLAGCGISQTSGKTALRASSSERARARAILRGHLETISRTARGVNLTQFWIPRDKSDRTLVEVGHMFATRAEPLKQVFIDSHMPPNFMEELNAAVQNLEKTIKDQVFNKGTRLAATAAIEQARNEGLSALKRLDPLMENLLRDDPATLAVWDSVRHVEQYSPPVRSVTTTDAPAAQA